MPLKLITSNCMLFCFNLFCCFIYVVVYLNCFRLKGRRHVSGRYTQLVWADTYLIGCARAVFQHSRGSNVVYHENAICNYGPSGNIPNLPVYKVGVPCSLCPEGTACSNFYRSLCEGSRIY